MSGVLVSSVSVGQGYTLQKFSDGSQTLINPAGGTATWPASMANALQITLLQNNLGEGYIRTVAVGKGFSIAKYSSGERILIDPNWNIAIFYPAQYGVIPGSAGDMQALGTRLAQSGLNDPEENYGVAVAASGGNWASGLQYLGRPPTWLDVFNSWYELGGGAAKNFTTWGGAPEETAQFNSLYQTYVGEQNLYNQLRGTNFSPISYQDAFNTPVRYNPNLIGHGGGFFSSPLGMALLIGGGILLTFAVPGLGLAGLDSVTGEVIGDLSGFGASEFVTPELLQASVEAGTLLPEQAASILSDITAEAPLTALDPVIEPWESLPDVPDAPPAPPENTSLPQTPPTPPSQSGPPAPSGSGSTPPIAPTAAEKVISDQLLAKAVTTAITAAGTLLTGGARPGAINPVTGRPYVNPATGLPYVINPATGLPLQSTGGVGSLSGVGILAVVAVGALLLKRH